MKPHSLRLTALLLMLLALAGCKKITVDTPLEDGIYATPPDITLTLKDVNTSELAMTLNGVNVTNLFTTTATSAKVTGTNIKTLLVGGDNIFRVTAPEEHTVNFYYDIVGPEIHLTQVQQTTSVHLVGYAYDPSALTSLSINNANILLQQDGSFDTSIASASQYKFVAIDTLGNRSETTLIAPDSQLVPAISARLNRTGLDFLVGEIQQYVAGIDYGSMIRGLNPLYAGGCDSVSCWWTWINLTGTDLRMSAPDIYLEVANSTGTFNLWVILNNLAVDIDASWAVSGIPGGGVASVNASRAQLSGTAQIVIQNQQIGVSISSLNMSLEGFSFDIDWLWDAIESIFYGLVQDIVENAVGEQLQAQIPSLMSGFLAQIPTDVQLDLAGKTFEVKILPQSLTSPNSGLTVVLGGGIANISSDASMGAALGSVYRNDPMPALNTTTPTGKNYDVGAVLAVNLVNQALLSAYGSGLMKISTDGDGVTGIPALPGASVRVNIQPYSPPFVELKQNQFGLAELKAYDLLFSLDYKPSGASSYTPNFQAVLNVGAPFDLGVSADNFLQAGIEELPFIKVRSVTNLGTTTFNEATVQALVDWIMPQLLPKLANAIGTVPVPSYAGYGLKLKEMWVADTPKSYLAIAGDLVKVATTAAATPPLTIASLNDPERSSIAAWINVGTALSGDEVRLYVSGENPTDQPLEYRYRLDQGDWSLWKEREQIVLRRVLSGDHTVEVCSRTYLLKENTACDEVLFTVK